VTSNTKCGDNRHYGALGKTIWDTNICAGECHKRHARAPNFFFPHFYNQHGATPTMKSCTCEPFSRRFCAHQDATEAVSTVVRATVVARYSWRLRARASSSASRRGAQGVATPLHRASTRACPCTESGFINTVRRVQVDVCEVLALSGRTNNHAYLPRSSGDPRSFLLRHGEQRRVAYCSNVATHWPTYMAPYTRADTLPHPLSNATTHATAYTDALPHATADGPSHACHAHTSSYDFFCTQGLSSREQTDARTHHEEPYTTAHTTNHASAFL
jgi:hypothetical protein